MSSIVSLFLCGFPQIFHIAEALHIFSYEFSLKFHIFQASFLRFGTFSYRDSAELGFVSQFADIGKKVE